MSESTVTEIISSKEISQKIEELSVQIERDYHNEQVILLGVLNGGFIVLADLSRALWRAGMHDLTIDFVKVTSYHDSADAHTFPHIDLDLNTSVTGKHVLIVEDIADTGITLNLLESYVNASHPKSLKIFALLNKPTGRKVKVNLDYVGFEVEGWVEGFGLDSRRASPSITRRNQT